MDQKIDDYIRQHRSTYTREAMRSQLISAGHDAGTVDEALSRLEAEAAASIPALGWRPRWITFLVLAGLGAVGAAVVWAGQPYGSGVIAPIVYLVLVGIGFGIAKALSIVIDSGSSTIPIVLLGLVAVAAGILAFVGSTLLLAGGVAVLATVLALVLLYLRKSNPRLLGTVGAAIPIIVWLAITGTCYAPALATLGSRPTTTSGTMEITIDPPLTFTGSGTASCDIYSNRFVVNGYDLGSIDGKTVRVSIGPPDEAGASFQSLDVAGHVLLGIDIFSESTGFGANYQQAVFPLNAPTDGRSGTVKFSGLVKVPSDPASPAFGPDLISGTITWTC